MHLLPLSLTLLITTLFHLSLPAQCWNLVWEDEFNGASLDLSKWAYQTGGDGFGNNELQYYTAGDNVEVSNGSLKIIAKSDVSNQYPGNDYTSSRIRSQFKGDWLYGKMEASIKLPIGQGIWPAFWMMPTDDNYGGWPASGEIDIMEYLGHEPNKVHGTCHFGNFWNDKSASGNSTVLPSGTFPQNYHTFTIEWEPGEIRWYLDSALFHVSRSSDAIFQTYNWPFDQRFHFILNLAVGGNWPGPPDGSTTFPQTMEVDWVRVYQKLVDISISGDIRVSPQASGVSYSIAQINGASYHWTVPNTATITSGQNSSEILVDWANNGGKVSVDVINNCDTALLDIWVDVTPNLWNNYNFEQGLMYWNTNTYNGAQADFDLVNTDVQEGMTSLCITTKMLGNDPWDIQLSRPNVDLEANQKYRLSFWAKADQTGKDIDLAFINASSFALYAGGRFDLTDSWAQYFFEFTAPVSATALFNIDLADELGTFCFDDFSFEKAIESTPIEESHSPDWVTLFPNPVKNALFIQGQNLQRVEIYQVNGQLLIEMGADSPDEMKVNVQDLPQGIYMVKIFAKGRMHSQTFLK